MSWQPKYIHEDFRKQFVCFGNMVYIVATETTGTKSETFKTLQMNQQNLEHI